MSVETAAECIAALEPNVPWNRPFLRFRQRVYARAHHPLAERAAEDLAEFARRASKDGEERNE